LRSARLEELPQAGWSFISKRGQGGGITSKCAIREGGAGAAIEQIRRLGGASGHDHQQRDCWSRK
jgi:hypothetical protein